MATYYLSTDCSFAQKGVPFSHTPATSARHCFASLRRSYMNIGTSRSSKKQHTWYVFVIVNRSCALSLYPLPPPPLPPTARSVFFCSSLFLSAPQGDGVPGYGEGAQQPWQGLREARPDDPCGGGRQRGPYPASSNSLEKRCHT